MSSPTQRTDFDLLFRNAYPLRRKIVVSRRTLPKIGRNAPCPCGSGRKYKKCCLKTKETD